jgi:putative Holliday junction resolvase
MRILSIDYGTKKIGLSRAETSLAEPYKVIRFRSKKEAIEKIGRIVKRENIEKLVVGVSEGKMGAESKRFGQNLKEKLGIPVAFQDETLTTQDAQKLSVSAGIKRKKRKEFEDAYSATLILQAYLDSLDI